MANPNPSPHTRFRSGASGNPTGSSRRAKFAGEAARITNVELMEIGATLLRGTMAQLQDIIADPEASVLQRWLAVLIRHSFLRGDSSIFRIVIDRVVGKAPKAYPRDQSHLSCIDASCRIAAMTYDEKVAELERLRRLRVAIGND